MNRHCMLNVLRGTVPPARAAEFIKSRRHYPNQLCTDAIEKILRKRLSQR